MDACYMHICTFPDQFTPPLRPLDKPFRCCVGDIFKGQATQLTLQVPSNADMFTFYIEERMSAEGAKQHANSCMCADAKYTRYGANDIAQSACTLRLAA